MLEPKNLYEPTVHVRHANLKRVMGSPFRSECPVCHEGFLLVARNQKTLELQAEDRCILCGQAFVYDDIEDLRIRETGK